MAKETALGAALRFGGILREDVEFDVAIAKYLNSGGTIDRAFARVNAAAARMSGMGHVEFAVTGSQNGAQTRQQVEGNVASPDVPKGHSAIAASPSSNHDERGQGRVADSGRIDYAASHRVPDRGGEGHLELAEGRINSALPVREPITSVTKRGLASIVSIQPVISKGLLELKKTSDGRSWGNVGWHELDGLDRDGAIARMVKQKANPPKNKFAELREVLSNKQFEEICNAAEKQNDHVSV